MKNFTILFIALFAATAMQAQIIHVPGDYSTIQQGINAATPGDTVMVAEGTYFEQINFLGKKPLMVASEFLVDGDTSHISKTIIDGSHLINMDSASVVYFISGEDTTSILCGFTIQNGKGTYASDNNGFRSGGGIWISEAGAKIIYNRITHNTLDDTQPGNGNSTQGGGIGSKYADGSFWLVIGNNTIDSNTCISKYDFAIGGGISTSYNSRIIGNVISCNSCSGMLNAVAGAGGIDCERDTAWINNNVAIIEHNTITHNLIQSQNNYGAIAGANIGRMSVIFSHNEVSYNTVMTGTDVGGVGGLQLHQPDPGSVVSNNVFKGNVSNLYAGALHLQNDKILDNMVLLENNYFFDNVAKWGGAFVTLRTPVTLQNNVFSGNHAEEYGGAVYLYDNFDQPVDHLATLINNSFCGNTATNYGGAIISSGIDPFILNSIFWQDSATNGMEIYAELGTLEIAYSDIDPELIHGTYIDGGGLINENPMFTNLKTLKPGDNSPCIDQGVMDYTCSHGVSVNAPEYDINGLSRPPESGIDMGAYEHSAIIHIPADYPTIQAGIDAANPGETVLVSEGTYFEQINFKGKKPLMVASEFLTDGDTSHISHTIIDGSHAPNPDSASVVYFISGEDTTSVLCGFTIQGGKGTNNSDFGGLSGGGFYIYYSGAKIIKNRIVDNIVDDTQAESGSIVVGGGIFCNSLEQQSWVVIEDNVIERNKAVSKFDAAIDGAFYLLSNARITNNKISDNSCTNTMSGWAERGAGCCDGTMEWGNVAIIRNNLIKDNISQGETAYYGGILMFSVKGDFSYNEVTGNKVLSTPSSTAGGDAGLGLWEINEGFVIRNNTFKENSSPFQGGGIGIETDLANPFPVLVENNYFLDNTALNGGGFSTINNPAILQNNIFSGNNAGSKGGAVYIWNDDTLPASHLVKMINNTFYNNNADSNASDIYAHNSNPLVFNSIFWQNPALPGSEIAVDNGFTEIAFSDLDTNKITGTRIIGAGMINADPMFNDITKLSVEPLSPCVDKGVAQYTCTHGETFQSPVNDILGNLRPVGAGYDMGAYDTLAPWGIEQITNYGLGITNWPNPFSVSTTFSYSLKESSQVTLQIFNSFGQLVAEPVNTTQAKGKQHVKWDAGNLPAGMYYYRLQAGGQVGNGKIVKW